MATQTVNFKDGQMQYILTTKGEQSFSERVRELVEKGMEVEQNDG